MPIWQPSDFLTMSDADLELYAIGQGDLANAAHARVELQRRARAYEKERWDERFAAESHERVLAQRFQAAQQEKQHEVAENHLKIARWSAFAAAASAIAALLLVGLTAFQVLN